MTGWWRKLAGWFRRETLEAELREEMRTHLEMKESAGLEPGAARRQFGNLTLLLEDSRAAWGWPRIEAWLRDFRYALRGLARSPGFAATVIVTLALGIGASSAVVSLADAVLLRPLPYPDSARLVSIQEARPGDARARTPVAPGRLEDWQRSTSSFAAIAGSSADMVTDTTEPDPERVSAAFVSPRFFAVIGARPVLGRVFTAEEERFGGPPAVVISHGFWQRRFAGSQDVLGRRLILAGRTYFIVGVMPAGFQYPSPGAEMWAPKQAGAELLAMREARFYECVGRLKPGVTLEQAQQDLLAVQQRLGERYPKTDAGWGVAVQSLKDRLVGEVRPALRLLLGSAGVLLLIACANVACLLLARLNRRSEEIATRCALGAGRAAIGRQLFAEGLVYALTGGFLGAAAAFSGIGLLRRQLAGIPRIAEITVDARMLALVAGISVLAALLFSVAPIMQTFRRDLHPSLIRGGRGSVGSRQRLPRILVSAQLALATALLIGAGLFLQSLNRLQETPLGFRPDGVLTLRVSASYSEPPEVTVNRHQRILEGLSVLPGVTAVAMSAGLPGVDPTWPREFEIAGEKPADGTLRFASWRIVTAGYFQTIGIPLLEGRTCRMTTDPQRPFEALVNRSFAGRYFQGRDPVGHSIVGGPQGGAPARIVGVVADVREDGQGAEPQPLIYACGYLRYWPDSDYLVQTRNPAVLAGSVQAAVRRMEPSRPVYAVRTLPEALHGALALIRLRTLIVGLFSIVALALAAIGLYGVMAYTVSQRTREIAIRSALGARPSQIAREILRSGTALAGAGAAAGVVLAAAGSRLLGALLYGIRPSDVAAYLEATFVLFLVALLACVIPGRRATSIEPTEALRY